MNLKSILSAKFSRDGKNLRNTFLADLASSTILNYIKGEVPFESDENLIVIYYESESHWYFISDKRIVECQEIELFQAYIEDISGLVSLIHRDNFLNEKKKGLDYIELILKKGSTHKLNVEKESFSLIDGIISFLISSTER